MGHNPRVELCPKSARKMKKKKKMEDLGKMGFWVFCGKSGENEEMGGRRWVVMAERGRQWDGGGGFVMGYGDGGFALYGATVVWEEWGRNDLKIGPVMAWLECVRTYISAFDHTRAWHMWCKWAQRSSLQGKFERKRA
jgi:hypothetical protein